MGVGVAGSASCRKYREVEGFACGPSFVGCSLEGGSRMVEVE